jgi:hypothetical protein
MKSDLSKSGWASDPASGLDVVSGLLGCAEGDDLAGFDMLGAAMLIDGAEPALPALPKDSRPRE